MSPAGDRATVYPRVCGGTRQATERAQWATGLSPRVRGNRVGVAERVSRDRSIPACAGEPSGDPLHLQRTSVYPRVCGGTRRPSPLRGCMSGLSPRVRGNRTDNVASQLCQGSIPACAGEPVPYPLSLCRYGVYPRVCGGTIVTVASNIPATGLSPRVRGNRHRRTGMVERLGSIPACAGEPLRDARHVGAGPVYPRVCGGTPSEEPLGADADGLSPRVRGNHCGRAVRATARGSIPACAGEPIWIGASGLVVKVYPRVCGGTFTILVTAARMRGLSPRVRGNLLQGGVTGQTRRSIPACAGEPAYDHTDLVFVPVYPRVCGGTPQRSR